MVKRTAKHDEDEAETEIRTVRGASDNAPETEVSGKKLGKYVKDIEQLEAKKSQLTQEIREIYAGAKEVGMDPKTIRAIVRERKMDPEKVAEQRMLMKIYREALGMLDDDDE